MYYSVSLMYKNIRNDSREPLWEESIILISAMDEDEAKLKAITLAKNQESEYKTRSSTIVKWKLYKVERIFSIEDDLVNGTELFSRFLKESEARSLLESFDD